MEGREDEIYETHTHNEENYPLLIQGVKWCLKKIYKPKVNDEIITNDIISIINEEMKNGESGIDSLKEHSA